MILAGDIGGTNTRLALFEKTEQGFRSIAEKKFSSSAYKSLLEVVQSFLGDGSHSVDRACFGVPGPVRGKTAKITNLPWIVDTGETAELIGHDCIGLINDLESNAYGLNELEETDFAVLNQGESNPTGNCAIISAGTGLGEAGIHNKNGELRPFASEGGHTDFAPRNELEIELLRYLLTKFDRVSVERVVSGMGLQNIYEFLRDTKRAEEPIWLAEEIKASGDVGAVVSQNGLEGKSAICEQTLDIFVSLYGAEAGNLALKILTTGGIFVGGGIAPKILPKLKEKFFIDSFLAKGRMRGLLEQMPVRVVLNDKAALLGAAHFAHYKITKDE
ncbi:glucokinase [soil metagenome]